MSAHPLPRLVPIAALGLLVACGDAAGPGVLDPGRLPPASADRLVPDPGVPLQVRAAVKLEEVVEGQTIREVIEMTAYFPGREGVPAHRRDRGGPHSERYVAIDQDFEKA